MFLVALCLSIFLDAIQRFVEPQEVQNPQIVLIVGGVGLAFNILGLFVFHQHSHDHGHEEGVHEHDHGHEHADELISAENGHAHHEHAKVQPALAQYQQHLSPTISWRIDESVKHNVESESTSRRRHSVSSNRSGKSNRRSRVKSTVDDLPIHPASWRNEIMNSARYTDEESEPSTTSDDETALLEPSEHSPLLKNDSNRTHKKRRPHSRDVNHTDLDGANVDHKLHKHNQPRKASAAGHGHSHSDMNIRGLFLHVLGDALGNIGVMASALIIWLTTSPSRFYADPAISLIITLIILKTAVPMCKDTAKPLLQATPDHINVDDVKEDIESLDGVRSCHHIHVWALTPSKPIATLDVELSFDFQGHNAARYMQLAKEIKSCLHGHGIHSSTIQPEFCLDPEHHKDSPPFGNDARRSESTTSTVRTAITARSGGEAEVTGGNVEGLPQTHSACLLDCNDACATGKQCCGPGSGTATPKNEERSQR